MIMNIKNQLRSMARTVMPGVGFALTCTGAYLISLQTEHRNTWRVITAYIIIVIGFLAILTGVFWNIFHRMKSKMYQRGERGRHMQVYAIGRPSSFPPSYEESQGSQERPEFMVVVDGVDMVMSLAPPLYSQDSLEAPDCTWSWEQPPPYSQVERIQQGEVDEEERREALSGH